VKDLAPQQIDETKWYYEMPTHLLLVYEIRDNEGRWIRTDQTKIPWAKLKRSLDRAYKLRKKKAKRVLCASKDNKHLRMLKGARPVTAALWIM
jgi:hypothetical protein